MNHLDEKQKEDAEVQSNQSKAEETVEIAQNF